MSAFYLDLGRDVSQTVVVAGTGRSGTTWLGHVIASATRSREIFEPFLHGQPGDFLLLRRASPMHLDRQLYIAPCASCKHPWYGSIARVMEGQLRCRWTDTSTRPGIYSRRIIKEIRANLFLAYLATTFPRSKFILVVRNPHAVVKSQLVKIRDGWVFEWEPEFVLAQPELIRDWLSPYLTHIRCATNRAEKQVLKWCIETLVGTRSVAGLSNVLTVRYDDLCKSHSGWEDIAQFVGLERWSQRRFMAAVRVRSRTSEPERAQRCKPGDQLSDRDLAVIDAMVREFGLSEFLVGRESVATPTA